MPESDHPLDRLVRWLDRHVTEQRTIGIQPLALLVVSSMLILSIAWIWHKSAY
jgi:hypothetical protein